MEGYLGETDVKSLEGTPFEGFTETDWAMTYIERYGSIDGDHHKQWVLDQMARVLKGTPVEVKLAQWSNGEKEYRLNTVEPPSSEYLQWVEEMKGEYDEEDDSYEYDYDVGIAP